VHGSAVLRTTVAGPWGPVHLAASEAGIVAVGWQTTETAFDGALVARLGSSVEVVGRAMRDDPRRRHLDAGVAALDTFLAGRPPGPGLRFDLADRPTWDRRVLEAVADIPWGRTASYGEVARRIGAPRAARAVGGALGRNPISLLIPCHRVIAADGTIGGYGGDEWGSRVEALERKRALLLREGVTVAESGPQDRGMGRIG
jgi:methylated-DNA-[protein]-cysteine S-methyltransferase